MGTESPAAELPALDFEDGPGWIWTVYPACSTDPMVAVGHSGNEDRARKRAEEELSGSGAFAVVIGPHGQQDVGRRDAMGGVAWRPMFPSP